MTSKACFQFYVQSLRFTFSPLDVHWNHLSWTLNHLLHKQPPPQISTIPLCHFNCQSVSPSTQPSLATSVCISTGNLFHLFIFIRHIPTSPHPSLHCSTLQRSLQNDREWVEMREVTSSLEWEGRKRKGLCEAQLGDVPEKCYPETFPRPFYTTKGTRMAASSRHLISWIQMKMGVFLAVT